MKSPGQRLGEMINHPQPCSMTCKKGLVQEDCSKLIMYFQCNYKDRGYPEMILKGENK